MKKIILFTVIGILFSFMAFGSYIGISGCPLTSLLVWIPGPLVPIPITPPSVLPANLLPYAELIYGIPVGKNFSITFDLEGFVNNVHVSNIPFVSGTIGARYTSDTLDTFMGPLKIFAGISGGGIKWIGDNNVFFVGAADGGVSFNLIDNIETFWDFKYYFPNSDQITYYNSPFLALGGLKFDF
ncbi:hypothetical protein [Athalassotoga saccharophila]|uniref:hypothetical protein n=1 Tax=Athalassotoga saccharophila TaxID=1441386 RepID=UPI00137A4FA8|nr:hypothetical protein [Athalassotoga saccharophila]BBJ28606.1 hypothetical protein ATHSA_1525 [Athalassotoga saccharophila]